MKIKIVTVHFGKLSKTFNFLKNLKKISWLNHLILVNNDHPNQGLKIKKKFPEIILINSPNNKGYGSGLNLAIKKTFQENPEAILIVNNDIILEKTTISCLIDFIERKKVHIISPKILDSRGKIWFAGGEIDKNRFTAGHKAGKLDFLSGCCMLIKSEVFKKIGLFDEKFFMYYEDVDFCLRARKVGFKLAIVPQAIAYHYQEKNFFQKNKMEYYLAKNHLLFVKKHAPFWVKIREILRLPKTLYQHWKNKNFSAIKGVIEGIIQWIGI